MLHKFLYLSFRMTNTSPSRLVLQLFYFPPLYSQLTFPFFYFTEGRLTAKVGHQITFDAKNVSELRTLFENDRLGFWSVLDQAQTALMAVRNRHTDPTMTLTLCLHRLQSLFLCCLHEYIPRCATCRVSFFARLHVHIFVCSISYLLIPLYVSLCVPCSPPTAVHRWSGPPCGVRRGWCSASSRSTVPKGTPSPPSWRGRCPPPPSSPQGCVTAGCWGCCAC